MMPFRTFFACFMLLLFLSSARASKPPSAPVLSTQKQWKHTFPETQYLQLCADSSRYFAFWHQPAASRQSPSLPQQGPEVVVIDRKRGNVLWRKPLGEVYADERHLYQIIQHQSYITLHCLDWANGNELWHKHLPYGEYHRLWTLPNKPEYVFYVRRINNEQYSSIFCLDSASGRVSWQAQGMRYYLGATREHLYFSSFGTEGNIVLYRLYHETGKALPTDPVSMPDLRVWTPESGEMTYAPQSQRYVFEDMVSDTGTDVSAFFVTDAHFRTLWREDGPQGHHSGPGKVFVEGDIIGYIMTNDKRNDEQIAIFIEARNLSTGHLLWHRPIKAGPVWETNSLAGLWRGVWLYQHENQLFGLGLRDGKVKWSLPLPIRVRDVRVEDQQLLVVQEDEKHDTWNILVY